MAMSISTFDRRRALVKVAGAIGAAAIGGALLSRASAAERVRLFGRHLRDERQRFPREPIEERNARELIFALGQRLAQRLELLRG